MWASNLTSSSLLLMWASNLTSFLSGGRNWLHSAVGDPTWVEFNVEIGIDLVFAWGSKITWFLYTDRNYLGFCGEAYKINLNSDLGSKPICFLCGGSKLTWFWCGYRSRLCGGRRNLSCCLVVFGPVNVWFSCMDWNLLGLSVGIVIDMFLLCGPKLNCFQCGDRLTWFLCGWSKLPWVLCAGRKSLGFIISINLDFVFVWIVEIDLTSAWAIEIDLIKVQGSELTWFFWGVRKWLGFSIWIEINFVFLCGDIKIDSNLKWLDTSRGSTITWFLGWGTNCTMFWCWWSYLTWFHCGRWNSTRFRCRDPNWHSFCEGVENNSFFLYGSQETCFFCRGTKFDLILESGSKWLDISGVVEINLFFMRAIEFDFVLVMGSKFTCFCAGGSNWLCAGGNWRVFSAVIDLHGFSLGCRNSLGFLCGPEIAWFHCHHRNWLGFCVGSRNWLVSVWGISLS